MGSWSVIGILLSCALADDHSITSNLLILFNTYINTYIVSEIGKRKKDFGKILINSFIHMKMEMLSRKIIALLITNIFIAFVVRYELVLEIVINDYDTGLIGVIYLSAHMYREWQIGNVVIAGMPAMHHCPILVNKTQPKYIKTPYIAKHVSMFEIYYVRLTAFKPRIFGERCVYWI